MSGRRILIGCGVAALLAIVVVVVGGIVVFRRITTPHPLESPARLVSSEAIGYAVLHLEADDPWVIGAFREMSQYSTRDQAPTEIFPMELVWSSQPSGEGAESHLLGFSVSPRGRMMGMFLDFALWRIGRSGEGNASRVVHAGEGITSFGRAPIRGYFFVRDNCLVWTSELEQAKQAVDRLVAAREESGSGSGSGAAGGPPILAQLPAVPAHTLQGAALDEAGSLARLLDLALPPSRAPGTIPPGTRLTFTLDTSTADEAAGRVTLQFPDATAETVMKAVMEDLSARLREVSAGQLHLEVAAALQTSQAVLEVKATGLQSLLSRVLKDAVKLRRSFEGQGWPGALPEADRPEEEAAPADPNQSSSSTFQ